MPKTTWLYSKYGNKYTGILLQGVQYYETFTVKHGGNCSRKFHDLSQCLRYSEYLLFMGELKFYHRIEDVRDHAKVQDDIHFIQQQSIQNEICFNKDKCVVLYCSRKKECSYMNTVIMKHSQLVLGKTGIWVWSTTSSLLSKLMSKLVTALRTLEFLLRHCKYFEPIKIIILLYNLLFRYQLEYCYVVQHPAPLIYKKKLKRFKIGFTIPALGKT